MKIDRPAAIMNYLLCHGKISEQGLPEEFEVSILSFGNNVTILEPQSVIDRIVAACDAAGKQYKEDDNEYL